MPGFDDKLNEEKIRADIRARMPLELNRKPVQTFLEGGSYPTSGDGVKRTREA